MKLTKIPAATESILVGAGDAKLEISNVRGSREMHKMRVDFFRGIPAEPMACGVAGAGVCSRNLQRRAGVKTERAGIGAGHVVARGAEQLCGLYRSARRMGGQGSSLLAGHDGA